MSNREYWSAAYVGREARSLAGILNMLEASAFACYWQGNSGCLAPARRECHAKKTPSPFLAKELQARQEEERQRLLAQTLPAEVGVPLLQGVVRRQAVRVVSRYWHHHRDDCAPSIHPEGAGAAARQRSDPSSTRPPGPHPAVPSLTPTCIRSSSRA